MKEQRTLCYRCTQDYQGAGYRIKRDYSVEIKDGCDICGRMGWAYWITAEKRNRVNKTVQ